MAVRIESCRSLGIIVAIVKPIGSSVGFVPLDLDDDVCDVVTSGSRTQFRGIRRSRFDLSVGIPPMILRIASWPFIAPSPISSIPSGVKVDK